MVTTWSSRRSRCARRTAGRGAARRGRSASTARTWAVEGAGGVGYLLAQQLVAAGERVLDVPATLAARVRVLGSGRSNKNDANDGYSIAVAALHAPHLARSRRRITRRVASPREAQPGARQRPDPHGVPAACAARRVGAGRNHQGNHGQSGRGAAGRRDTDRSGGSDPPRVRPRASRGPAPHRRADARLEAAPRRRGPGVAARR